MSRSLAPLAAGLSVLLLAGCVTASRVTVDSSASQRAADALARDSAAIGEKEQTANVPTAHVLVATDVLPDGTSVTLWTHDPAVTGDFRSRCFYLDYESPSAGAHGMGACGGGPDTPVSVTNPEAPYVGSVGHWPAATVRITVDGADTDLPVVNTYFLIPHPMTPPFTFSLLGADGAVLGTVSGLTSPGSAEPSPPR